MVLGNGSLPRILHRRVSQVSNQLETSTSRSTMWPFVPMAFRHMLELRVHPHDGIHIYLSASVSIATIFGRTKLALLILSIVRTLHRHFVGSTWTLGTVNRA